MPTLLDLTTEAQELDAALDRVEDLNEPEVQALLERMLDLSLERNNKVDGYCGLIRELELRAEARANEATRLNTRAQVSKNLADSLKSRLLEAFGEMGIKKLETDRFTVTRAKNGGKTPMDVDEANVSKEYTTQVVTTKINKEKIREDLTAGKTLTFAKLGERGVHLRIK